MPMARSAASHHQRSGGIAVARRWSSQIMAGRKGWPSASSATVVPRWVVMTTPRTASFGTRVWAHSSWQASHRLRQKASGSFSSQPGCGDW